MLHVITVAGKGCPDIPPPESGRFVKTVFGTVLVVECNPGYILNGSPMLYCDRYEWNGTTPLCQGKSTNYRRLAIKEMSMLDDILNYVFISKEK